MLTTASCWRECTRCFCFASPSNFAFTWATGITIHVNSCPVKCCRNVASPDLASDKRAGSGLFKQPTTKEPLAVELPERDANRCILVRGCKPVSVLLCDAEELLHLLRSWRCGRPVRIEWPRELSEEAVEFLLAHVD